MLFHHQIPRRKFVKASFSLAIGSTLAQLGAAADKPGEPVIDVHQHTHYSGRTDEQLIAHQKAMGVTTTVLLPAGRLYGLDADCGGNETVADLARRLPGSFLFFANEIAGDAAARTEITRFLKEGGIGIGEQKFRVACDSPEFWAVAEIAQEFAVPVLMHFWDLDYNTGIARMERTLNRFPKVNFIGHAQSWWANIDRNYDSRTMYPAGKVVPGGLTERLLSNFPNMFGDLSAGSGLNALLRDEENTRAFLDRHQNKLLFGSDCNDLIGEGPGCQGSQILAAIRRLAPSRAIERKILFENARQLLKLKL